MVAINQLKFLFSSVLFSYFLCLANGGIKKFLFPLCFWPLNGISCIWGTVGSAETHTQPWAKASASKTDKRPFPSIV